MGAESYALPVANVLEVVRSGLPAPLPGSGDHVVGMLNLRGHVIPVFDLGALLGATRAAPPEQICIATHAAGLGGLAVEEVTGVAELPDGGTERDEALLARATLVDGRLVGVVDMDALFTELERRGGL